LKKTRSSSRFKTQLSEREREENYAQKSRHDDVQERGNLTWGPVGADRSRSGFNHVAPKIADLPKKELDKKEKNGAKPTVSTIACGGHL
jgi:hypothetical protein